jgi:hypothetical protein
MTTAQNIISSTKITFEPIRGVISKYHGVVRQESNSFFTYIVREEKDGFISVIYGFKPRHFTTFAKAELSIRKHMAKYFTN